MSRPIPALSSEPSSEKPEPPAKGPLLASEVLLEDAAPLEPGRRAMRVWLCVIGAVLVGLGLAFQHGSGGPGHAAESAALSFSAAGTLATIAALPFPYAVRASLSLLVAATSMVLGLRGSGPLAGLSVDGGLWRDAARLLGMTSLAAALLFRSRYAEYRRSELVLLLGFALALPFVGAEIAVVADTGSGLALRSWAALNVLVLSGALLGLLPAAAGVGANALAALVLVLAPGGIALRAFSPLARPDSGAFTYPLTALACTSLSVLSSLGLFQLLSWFMAPAARRLSRTAVPRA